MNEQEKKSYLQKYKEAKEKGVPFFPDIIFKDAIIALVVFLILVALAYFIGAPVEARANPNDTTYTPRPEWYFLFLFQLLKYFPGKLEFIGAMLLPGLFILLLLILPFIDKSPKRHFRNRPWYSLAALIVVFGIGLLTVLSVIEAPPPQEAVVVDRAAALYTENCAGCHGSAIDVQPETDLYKIIASGNHEGMPAWGGDLSTDEIDLLVGFILSPNGSQLYNQQCATCHEQALLAVGNPLEIKRVLDLGLDYPNHQDVRVPKWSETLSLDEQNALINFLAAPDGQRLFTVNCSGCHGQGVAFTGSEEELRDLIATGGQHQEMPGWKGTLSEADLNTLAAYVADPASEPGGAVLFGQHCTACHGDRVPTAPDVETARVIIATGGPHVEMPIWGKILTPEALDALVTYTFEASRGSGAATGASLFAEYCSACHGQFGEGGINPALAGDIILPISSAEYLKTRNDATLRLIISQGQPTYGMSAFGEAYGGPLSDDQIAAIVAFLRSWESNPPVSELPEYPTSQPVAPTQPTPSGSEVSFSGQVLPLLQSRCQVCHNEQSALGGWDAHAFNEIMTTGKNAPVVIPGDITNSILAQRVTGTKGSVMPPSGMLSEQEIQIILDWISASAPDN